MCQIYVSKVFNRVKTHVRHYAVPYLDMWTAKTYGQCSGGGSLDMWTEKAYGQSPGGGSLDMWTGKAYRQSPGGG